MTQADFTGFKTIVTREVIRILRIWPQSFLPSIITMTLYFVIFGNIIGSKIGRIDGFSYMQYIAPGLIMMAVITNSYSNVVSSFYSSRFQRSIEELLISPMPNWLILSGFVVGGMLRGLLVGIGVTAVALFFTHLSMHHLFSMIAVVLLSSILFSLAGFTNAVFARNFDDITIIPTFVLTPLTYLGGVFYSINALPAFWRHLSLGNPILYMVNAFRFGILGITDIRLGLAFILIILFCILLFMLNLRLLKKGTGLRA